jgi:uncharacterized membrane protein
MGFLEEYFIEPITNASGYNIVNTLVFAAVLITSVYFLVKVLRKLGIKMDKKLWYDLLPFVFLGGVLRALEDAHAFDFLGSAKFVFVTPLIYFFVFAVVFILLLTARFTRYDVTRNAGIFLLAFFSANVLLGTKNVEGFLIAVAITAVVFGATYFAVRKIKPKLMSWPNSFPLFAHSLDSCSSVTAVSIVGGYSEQHVVPGMIFNWLPYWTFIIIKVAIILAALYVIDKELPKKKDGDWRWMLKFTIFVLGAGPGTRNTLTMLLGTNM